MSSAGDVATVTFDADLAAAAFTLIVKKEVQDATGNSMIDDYTQSFGAGETEPSRGEGYVTGVVIDASTGRPLAGASVEVFAPVNSYGGRALRSDAFAARTGRPRCQARRRPTSEAATHARSRKGRTRSR